MHVLGRRNDVPDIMMGLDLYLFPSYREGVPVSVQEAMAAEIPVVAFNIRGCREAIVAGETGVITPFKDVPKFADAAMQLINQPECRQKYGKTGRLRIMNEYTAEHHVARQMPIYRQLYNNAG